MNHSSRTYREICISSNPIRSSQKNIDGKGSQKYAGDWIATLRVAAQIIYIRNATSHNLYLKWNEVNNAFMYVFSLQICILLEGGNFPLPKNIKGGKLSKNMQDLYCN